MNGLKLSSPWVTYYRQVQAMFKKDPQVHVTLDDANYAVKVYVDDQDKADAIASILDPEVDLGNIKLKIIVVPADRTAMATSNLPLFERAFKNNPALSYTTEITELFDINYVVFANEVVQYFNDNIADPHGLTSTLYADIAYVIFRKDLKVSYATDVPANSTLGMPLGEWPWNLGILKLNRRVYGNNRKLFDEFLDTLNNDPDVRTDITSDGSYIILKVYVKNKDKWELYNNILPVEFMISFTTYIKIEYILTDENFKPI